MDQSQIILLALDVVVDENFPDDQGTRIPHACKAHFQLIVTEVSGTSPVLDCRVQWSNDQEYWTDGTEFSSFTSTGSQIITSDVLGAYARLDYVASGDSVFNVRAYIYST